MQGVAIRDGYCSWGYLGLHLLTEKDTTVYQLEKQANWQIVQNEARMLVEFYLRHRLHEQGVLDMGGPNPPHLGLARATLLAPIEHKSQWDISAQGALRGVKSRGELPAAWVRVCYLIFLILIVRSWQSWSCFEAGKLLYWTRESTGTR